MDTELMEFYSMILTTVGLLTVIALATAVMACAVRWIVRSFVDIRYGLRVKYYVEDSRKRIFEYDRRIREVENMVKEKLVDRDTH